jgi:hypothetical protein
MCDISEVVGVISMVNATCGTGPYLPSGAFVSKLLFLWVSGCGNCNFLMRTIVCLLFSLFLTFLLWYVSLF